MWWRRTAGVCVGIGTWLGALAAGCSGDDPPGGGAGSPATGEDAGGGGAGGAGSGAAASKGGTSQSGGGAGSGGSGDAGVDAGAAADGSAGAAEAGADASSSAGGAPSVDASVDAASLETGVADASDGAGASSDAGSEAGAPDASLPTPAEASALIQAAHDSARGAVSLPISGAIVTYLKPVTGEEPAAFFVQAERLGPALLVEVDPASLDPAPTVGATVSFQIDTLFMTESLLRATAISGFTVHSTGADVEALRQDVSAAADLVTSLDSYESELISITGTVTTDFQFIVLDQQAARFDTAGISGSTALLLRLTNALVDDLGMRAGCSLSLNAILWRTAFSAQPSGYYFEDLANVTCPAPELVSALATSADRLVLDFNRWIDASSVSPDGSQFTLSQGLTALAVEVSGRAVTLTTTTQTPGTSYTVSVANTVLDVFGAGVGAPGNASFDGYTQPASVLVSEVQCLGSAAPEDYIELYVTGSGPMAGFTVEQWAEGGTAPQEEYRFDAAFNVTAGDFVVLHYDSANQGNFRQEDDSGSSKTESKATDAVASAWDVYTNLSRCYETESLILVRDNFGTVLDSIAVSNRDGAINVGMRNIFNAIRADSSLAWTGFSADADGSNDALIQSECAPLGTSIGESAQRDSDHTPGGGGVRDTGTSAEWCAAAQTMGTTNVDCP